ncbi:MAG: Ig-like domain-containing protein [Thermoplasmatota archaeon]
MGKRIVRAAALWLTALVIVLALPTAPTGADEGGGSSRATDSEPANNDPATAPDIASGEVVEGSLMLSPTNDYQDFYHIFVPYKSVLNASLKMVTYNPAMRNETNFNLQLWVVSGGNYARLASSWTENQWDNVISLQIYSTDGLDVWVEVRVNHTNDNPPVITTRPGSYTVSATVSEPTPYTGGAASGYLDVRNSGSVGKFYTLSSGLADNRLAHARLSVPVNGDFDLFAYNIWPRHTHNQIGTLWLQNASWTNSSLGNVEEVKLGGMDGGEYFFWVRCWDGAGTYSFTIDTTASAIDDNNAATKATPVNDNYPHDQFIDQGLDPTDWWMVNMRAGRMLPEIYFTLTTAANNNLMCMLIYDKDMNLKSQKYNTQNGGWPDFSQQNPNPITNYIDVKDLVVGYDGPIYICLQAVVHFYGSGEGAAFIPSKGSYKLTFTLPNDKPQFNGPIPDVHMNEDTRDESLLLSNYFSDPDGNSLNYTIVGSSYNTRPTVDITTGLVTFSPQANWTGSEVVKFRATDNGPGNKWEEGSVKVIVEPVNDAPYLVNPLSDISVQEESVAYTADLTTVFTDIDDPVTSLSFNYRVVTSDTHPPGSSLPVSYDLTNHRYKLGPAIGYFGTFTIQVTCTDGHQGTTPAGATFTLEVGHRNHNPSLKEGIQEPVELTIKEGDKDGHLNVEDLFEDPDIPEDYANDALNYLITGAQRLTVDIDEDGFIIFDTGREEYIPGSYYEEKIMITAKDRAGLRATLNFTIFVDPVNDPPTIVTYQPVEDDPELNEGQSQRFSVTALDVDTETLTYTWYINGKKDKTAKGLTMTFEPDYTMGGTVHSIRVEVSDQTTTVSKEWNVTVNDVNRLPTGFIKSPANLTKFKKGVFVTFAAEGNDEDGDALTYIWKDAAGVELGRGPTFSTNRLPKGTQTVVLEITDGKGSTTQSVTIIIYADTPSQSSPGLEGAGIALAVAVCAALTAMRRRR